MRRALRGKSVGGVMSLVPSRHRGASGGVGKPSLVHGPLAAGDLDMALPVEASRREGELDQTAHAVRLPGRYDVVVGVLLLQHQPHRLDIVAGKAPIALRFEISKIELVLKTLSYSADRAGNLSRDEG